MTSTDQKTSNISVIIPARNEAAHIAESITSVSAEAREIIVVDCGSDASADIARHLGCLVITAKAGRASQMNIGARAASGEILLFLHADTTLYQGFSTEIASVLDQPNVVCGAFQLHLDQPGCAYRFLELATNLRATLSKAPYGDQAIFTRASYFHKINGYDDVPFLEDVLLIKAMKRIGKIGFAKGKVCSSGRRWQDQGIVRTTLTNRIIMLGFLLGASPQRLKKWYRIGKK